MRLSLLLSLSRAHTLLRAHPHLVVWYSANLPFRPPHSTRTRPRRFDGVCRMQSHTCVYMRAHTHMHRDSDGVLQERTQPQQPNSDIELVASHAPSLSSNVGALTQSVVSSLYSNVTPLPDLPVYSVYCNVNSLTVSPVSSLYSNARTLTVSLISSLYSNMNTLTVSPVSSLHSSTQT